MATLDHFAKRLRKLREEIPVKDLAANTGVSATAIYKAESGDAPVSWKTVEAAYGHLCKSDSEYADLLILWAMSQSHRKITTAIARHAMTTAVHETAAAITKETQHVIQEMQQMSLPSQRTFARVATGFRSSEMLRKMFTMMLEADETWRNESKR